MFIKKLLFFTIVTITTNNAFCTFSCFNDSMSVDEYIRTCIPHSSTPSLVSIFTKLCSERTRPILEDCTTSVDNIGKVVQESGYGHPPHMLIQGPFLAECSKERSSRCRVYDIGVGYGEDTIMALATGKTQVYSVDIHKKQLQELKLRVRSVLGEVAPKTFYSFRRDFSRENSVAPNWFGQVNVVNANKMFHFLNDEETVNMVKSVSLLLPDKGRFFITVCKPKPFVIKEFDRRKSMGWRAPGLIYYDMKYRTDIGVLGALDPTYVVLPRETEDSTEVLPSPGQKIEFMRGPVLVNRQGRHFHDIDTLSSYLNDSFTVIDSTEVQHMGETFLSVIAEKKS